MACFTKLKPRQTLQQRAEEVRKVAEATAAALAAGRIKPIISKAGAIAFQGLEDKDRDGVTDACIYRRIMNAGSQLARAAIERAEQLTGRKVDQKAIGVDQRLHSHDGGRTWHTH